MVDKSLSLVITSYNRDTMTVNSYSKVADDPRISEIVIVDDCSSPRYFDRLKKLVNNHPKVKLFQNRQNLGCYKNKAYAITQATSEYVIIFDSDNTLNPQFIDKLFSLEWRPDTIYAPDFARPHFDYTRFSGVTIDKNTVKKYIPSASQTRFDCLINTMNYFVNREKYLEVWDGGIEPWTADTIYQNYQWLKAGYNIYVVPGMQYDHLVHNGSHYQEHNRKTGNLYKEIENKMMRL